MFHRPFPLVFVLILLLSLSACIASAQVKTLGDISFAAPEGWTYEQKPGADHASMSIVAGSRYCVLGVYTPERSSGNAEADFVTAWRAVLRPAANEGLPTPIYDLHGNGYQGKYASTFSDGRLQWMYILESGKSAIPVVVLASDRQIFDELEFMIRQVVESVRLAPAKASAPKNNITVADLKGEWRHSADSSVDYVSSSGAYVSSSSVFYGETYQIAADGSYAYQMAGMSNRNIVREKETGVVELGEGLVIFKSSKHTRRTHFISYQQALNGSTVLTLLGDQYPISGPNIGMYGEMWVRAAGK